MSNFRPNGSFSLFAVGFLSVCLLTAPGCRDKDSASKEFQKALGRVQTNQFAELHSRAERGSAADQYDLGTKYAEGKGVPQSYGEAAKWLRDAARQGLASAQYYIAMLIINKHVTPLQPDEAIEWVRKAAE